MRRTIAVLSCCLRPVLLPLPCDCGRRNPAHRSAGRKRPRSWRHCGQCRGRPARPRSGNLGSGPSIGGRVYPVYVDCSRRYLLQGQFVRLSDKENITRIRYEELNRVDVSSIPLKNAVVLGKRDSKKRIIVLTDPSCPYCVKLHGAIKEAVAKDPEVAFFIMPYPRNRADKASTRMCLAAVCDKSGKTLDDVYAGKEVPPRRAESARSTRPSGWPNASRPGNPYPDPPGRPRRQRLPGCRRTAGADPLTAIRFLPGAVRLRRAAPLPGGLQECYSPSSRKFLYFRATCRSGVPRFPPTQ